MKHLKHLLAALVFVSLIIFTSCGGGGGGGTDPDPTDTQGEKLAATWTVTANGAQLESQAVDGWTGFVLTITYNTATNAGTYTTTNSGSTTVWPASGTWAFDGTNIGIVVRNDNVDIAVSGINNAATTLTLAFTISGGAARTSSVNGNWTFTFTAP